MDNVEIRLPGGKILKSNYSIRNGLLFTCWGTFKMDAAGVWRALTLNSVVAVVKDELKIV